MTEQRGIDQNRIKEDPGAIDTGDYNKPGEGKTDGESDFESVGPLVFLVVFFLSTFKETSVSETVDVMALCEDVDFVIVSGLTRWQFQTVSA